MRKIQMVKDHMNVSIYKVHLISLTVKGFFFLFFQEFFDRSKNYKQIIIHGAKLTNFLFIFPLLLSANLNQLQVYTKQSAE